MTLLFMVVLGLFFVYQVVGYAYFIINREGIMIKRRFVNIVSLLFILLTIYGAFSISHIRGLADKELVSQPCYVIYYVFHFTLLPSYTMLIFRSISFLILYKSHHSSTSHLKLKKILFTNQKNKTSKSKSNEFIVHDLPNSIVAYLYLFSLLWSGLAIALSYSIVPNEFIQMHSAYPTIYDPLCQGPHWYPMIAFIALLAVIEIVCAIQMYKIKDGYYISKEIILLVISNTPIFLSTLFIWAINRLLNLDNAQEVPTTIIHVIISVIQSFLLVHFPAILQFREFKLLNNCFDQRKEFNKIIKNPNLRKRLKLLSEERLCSELFKFLDYYEEFNKNQISEADMLKFFIVPDSPFWLNLSHILQNRIDANDLGQQFWIDVRHEVIELIFDNLFSAYIERYALIPHVESTDDINPSNKTNQTNLSAAQLSQFI